MFYGIAKNKSRNSQGCSSAIPKHPLSCLETLNWGDSHFQSHLWLVAVIFKNYGTSWGLEVHVYLIPTKGAGRNAVNSHFWPPAKKMEVTFNITVGLDHVRYSMQIPTATKDPRSGQRTFACNLLDLQSSR